MALVIFLIAPNISRTTEDKIGAVMSLGCFGAILIPALGFPLFFFWFSGMGAG